MASSKGGGTGKTSKQGEEEEKLRLRRERRDDREIDTKTSCLNKEKIESRTYRMKESLKVQKQNR